MERVQLVGVCRVSGDHVYNCKSIKDDNDGEMGSSFGRQQSDTMLLAESLNAELEESRV